MPEDDVTQSPRLEGDFGPNVGLVEEIYRQWLEDPASVSESWQDFFADYTPRLPERGGNGDGAVGTAQPAPAPEAAEAPENPAAAKPAPDTPVAAKPAPEKSAPEKSAPEKSA
ncbi:MAG TPA: hypothetical protein VFF24_04675, partial [Acidimicrobiia bacterium]|nr:hypothetical protein [Acidimicrobiia bacterium]